MNHIHDAGDRIAPGASIGNSEVRLASLSVAAFFLRLVCTNGMISKTGVSASYRHVSLKILNELPQVLERVSVELGMVRKEVCADMGVDRVEEWKRFSEHSAGVIC
jgi:hypothetical protein